MTSPGLSEFKTLLLATREREREIQEDSRKAKRQLFFSHAVRSLAWVTMAAAMSKSLRDKVGTAVAVRKSEVATLKNNLAASRISISFDMESAIAEPHREMLEAFDALSMSNRCWSIVNSQGIDRVRARTTASFVISRVLATLGRRADPLIDTQTPPLALVVQNGKATAYFYPGFILVVDGEKSDFAIIDLKDVDVLYSATRFTETETVPHDSTMVGKTWAKSNKDGSRDRRFNDNRELPVMHYGEMHLSTAGGMDEAFMFSNSDACLRFVSSVTALKNMLASGTHNKSAGGDRKTLPKPRS